MVLVSTTPYFPAQGHGWLIFALPPTEIAVHPAAENSKHEIYFMRADVAAAIQTLEKHKVQCNLVTD
jgi:hypothetical protein